MIKTYKYNKGLATFLKGEEKGDFLINKYIIYYVCFFSFFCNEKEKKRNKWAETKVSAPSIKPSGTPYRQSVGCGKLKFTTTKMFR